jgi:RND family efflux transporter MFP subunit
MRRRVPARAWLVGIGLCGTALSLRAEDLDCMIQPEQTVVVAAPQIGVVSEVLVDRGDLVKTGQVVARLVSTTEQAAVALAKARAESDAELQGSQARLDFETRRVERGRELRKQGVVSVKDLDEWESSLVVAEANLVQSRDNKNMARLELARAQAALELRTIHSPLDGVVVEIMLRPGEYADPPQVMKLAQIDPLRIEAYAPVAMLGHLEVGMPVKVAPEVGSPRDAKIVVVDRVVDGASGTFGVRASMPNPDHAVLAGLRCKMSFQP